MYYIVAYIRNLGKPFCEQSYRSTFSISSQMDARGFTLVPDLSVANTHTSKVHSADRRSADHEVLYLRPLNRLVGQQRRFTTGKLAVPFADNRRNLNPVTTRCERVCFEKQ
jgi:hypothetical protein